MSAATTDSLGSSNIPLDVLDGLDAKLTAILVGQPYRFGRQTHGGEMTFHFGAERRHAHPKLAGRIRGTHVLSLRGSAWMLLSGATRQMIGCGIAPYPRSDDGRPFNATALESGAFIAPGAVVESANTFAWEPLNAIGLNVVLSDGSRIMIVPTPPEPDEDRATAAMPEPADWELWTTDRVVQVGPGPKVETVDSLP